MRETRKEEGRYCQLGSPVSRIVMNPTKTKPAFFSPSNTKSKAEEPAEWIDKAARFGYFSKGVVHAIVGLLAAMTAFGFGGKVTGQKGAFAAIASQPFGTFLLIVLASGLACYVIWRLVQAWYDPDGKGTDTKGIFKRIGHVVQGLVYGYLAYSAVKVLMNASSSGGSSQQSMTAKALELPLGAWLVGAAGLAVIGYGISQLIRAYKMSFAKRTKSGKLKHQTFKRLVQISRFGITVRGLIIGMIGYFLLQAAFQSDPSETKGLDQTLGELSQQPYGAILLGVSALGLIAYGIYGFFMGACRKTVK